MCNIIIDYYPSIPYWYRTDIILLYNFKLLFFLNYVGTYVYAISLTVLLNFHLSIDTFTYVC